MILVKFGAKALASHAISSQQGKKEEDIRQASSQRRVIGQLELPTLPVNLRGNWGIGVNHGSNQPLAKGKAILRSTI